MIMTIGCLVELLTQAEMLDLVITKMDLVIEWEENGEKSSFRCNVGSDAVDDQPPEEEDDESIELVRSEDARSMNPGAKVSNLFGTFVCYINEYLDGHFEDADFEYLAANQFQISFDVEDVCDVDDGYGEDDPSVRRVFFEELPNIIALYESVGWKVSFEENDEDASGLRDGRLVFVGTLADSSYRKKIAERLDS